ncbi:hypothetical protein LCI18_013529 [Fusarium solani-melongenae]|uniref:Uncharacterized protein n=1 Tax=Fusarium solani subsp. cucurbitae TaxID=2747967 RepID=A0ACD3ZML2_FUSSC|nr:hypothetical protein LCI18_013529 [Fusarium solani-melongenae]
MAFAAQQRKESDSIFNETKDQPPEEDRMDDTKVRVIVAICIESLENMPIHHEEMSNPTEERNRTSILPRLREKLGHTRCPDPEGGIDQHNPHSHHHKDKNSFREHRQRSSSSGLFMLLELILWLFSTASCWMMERLARPGVDPSAMMFLAAIWFYAASTGMLYFIYSGIPFVDIGIVCSGVLGMVCGWIIQWALEKILFRLLPGFILSSLVLSGVAASVVKDPALE